MGYRAIFQGCSCHQDKVSVGAMYLSGDVKLWWRSRIVLDNVVARDPIVNWDVIKKEIKVQFLPNNASWHAREALKGHQQTNFVRDYVKKFCSLMLDIKDMSEEDTLFNIIFVLQTWAQTELRRQNIKTLSVTFSAADALVYFKSGPTNAAACSGSNSKRKH